MTPAERVTAAALQALAVQEHSDRITLDDLCAEIAASTARLLYRTAGVDAKVDSYWRYHEAGHMGVGCLLGIPMVRVSVGIEDASEKPSFGRAVFAATSADTAENIRDMVLMYLAGPAAERAAGNPLPTSADDDLDKVDELVRRLGYSEQASREYVRFCVQRVDDLVRQHWGWIVRIAEALRSRSSLEADEVQRLRPEPSEAAA